MATEPISTNIAVIPCRGGSKRVPRKNVRLLHGKPAVAYTIEAALMSGVFQSVIVSTDSEEIAEVSRAYGAEVPFVRDSSLADDYTPVSAVTLDVLNRLVPQSGIYDNVCQLMANCPLRTASAIRDSYAQFLETAALSQISVTEYGWFNPWWAMTRDDQNALTPLFKEQMETRSQDLPTLYCPTGAVWWAKPDVLRQYGTFYAPNYRGWAIPWQQAVDIDTEEDWKMAEVLMTGRLT
jgi:N-acylneuraminate cytidylyltransferase